MNHPGTLGAPHSLETSPKSPELGRGVTVPANAPPKRRIQPAEPRNEPP